MDKGKIDAFWNRRANVSDPRLATHFKHDNTLEYDIQLIEFYLKEEAKLLDLGCGTCAITNYFESKVNFICAVDKHEGFLQHCSNSNKIELIISDIASYRDDRKYDCIIIFGVMNYLSEDDARSLYERCQKMLTKRGVLIVKHACGVEEDIVVDKYSEAISDWYYAVYRWVDKEKNLLSEYFNVKIVDIYPPELNPWENTHFYAFVCNEKREK